MAQKSWHLDRRTALKGLGLTCFLPQLEAMEKSLKENPQKINKKRAAFVFFPNGCSIASAAKKDEHPWGFFPQSSEADYQATNVLDPLQIHRDKFTLLGGLSHPKSRTLLGHAAGDTWLTAGDIRGDYKNSISVDQIFSNAVGRQTRFPYLALSCDGGTGYKSRATTLSFDSTGRALPTQSKPRVIFDRIFASNNSPGSKKLARRRLRLGKKAVDFIMEDAKSLNRRLGRNDQQKLDEYMSSISDVEDRIVRTESWLDKPMKKVDTSGLDLDVNTSMPKEYIRAMYDLMALSFEADATRTISYMIAR